MKLIALFIYKSYGADQNPVRLASARDLSSFGFMARRTISEHCNFASRIVVRKTEPGFRQTISLNDNPFVCHTYVRRDGLSGVVVSDQEYVPRVAYGLINKFLADYDTSSRGGWKEEQKDASDEPASLADDLARFQNPREADKILKVQKQLDEVFDIMERNIEQVLARGERLEDLMAACDDLSVVSQQFLKDAKRANRCCKSF